MRIGIVGSGGTGKSGLANSISNKFNISFLQSKMITRDILNKYDYKWDSGIYVERFLALKSCQIEIFSRTVEKEKENLNFVSDRTSIDLAAYSILELNNSIDVVDNIVNMCKEHAKKYTHLIFCPWGIVPIEDNSLRTLNPWYQFTIHSIMLGLLQEWKLDYFLVKSTGDNRLEEIMEYLS